MEPGTARGLWARPAPASCHLHPFSVPLHTNSNMHTLSRLLTWPISLEHWRTASPFVPPPPMCVSVSLSQSLFLFPFPSHWHDTLTPLPTVEMTVCRQISTTLAKRTGKICVGIDPISSYNRNECFMSIIQDEETVLL